MLSAIHVSNFFVDVSAKNEYSDYMTNLRLQKLLFLAQGWHLARHDTPLFPERIEAWRYGPVVPEVYQCFNSNWKLPITATIGEYSESELSGSDIEFLCEVLSQYNSCTTNGLVTLTHNMTPWKNHVECSEEIPMSEIREFFKSIKPQLETLDDLIESMPVDAGIQGGDGRRCFPDWDND